MGNEKLLVVVIGNMSINIHKFYRREMIQWQEEKVERHSEK